MVQNTFQLWPNLIHNVFFPSCGTNSLSHRLPCRDGPHGRVPTVSFPSGFQLCSSWEGRHINTDTLLLQEISRREESEMVFFIHKLSSCLVSKGCLRPPFQATGPDKHHPDRSPPPTTLTVLFPSVFRQGSVMPE